MTVFDRTMTVLERALDARAARHQVIAANLANEETPGYRAKELPFREALAAAIRGGPAGALLVTHPRHLGANRHPSGLSAVRLVSEPAGAAGLDANTVNLDLELAKLADNTMQYQAAAAIMAIRLQQVLAAIRETQ